MKVENLKTTTQFTSVLKLLLCIIFVDNRLQFYKKNCRFMCEVTYHLSI